jgi:hypothetical protein
VATSVFAGEPQPVEIHHRGIWYAGELLGWRHEGDGRAVARVRCVVDGLRHSTWKDLGELRLPDPRRPPRAEAFPATPGVPPDPLDQPEDDETRPHVLLCAMRNPKPDHARTPPAGAAAHGDRPARPARPQARPLERSPARVASDEALPERRRLRPEWESTALTPA